MSLGGKGSLGCLSVRLPPAGHTPVAIHLQGSPREIRIFKSRSGMRALPRSLTRKRSFNRALVPHREKPLHSIYDRV